MHYSKIREDDGSLHFKWHENNQELKIIFEADGECHNGDFGCMSGLPVVLQMMATEGALNPTSLQNYLLSRGFHPELPPVIAKTAKTQKKGRFKRSI